jgi:hypothetical protein
MLFFLYHNDNPVSSGTKHEEDKPKKIRNEKKIRINRETYTTPEPCRGCPGEDGQGVQLSVIYIYILKKKFFFSLFILA